MKRLTRVLIPTTLLVLSLAPAALAGSVAVVTFAELPSDFDAGTPYTLDYSILAHGTEPMQLSDSSLHFQGPNGEDLTFPATPSGSGQWTAEVTLPEAGEWQWEVVSGDQIVQTLGTLPVLPAPTPVPTGLINTLRIAPAHRHPPGTGAAGRPDQDQAPDREAAFRSHRCGLIDSVCL